MSAIFLWGIHIWNFKTLACTVHKIWHVCFEQTDGQPETNMPCQVLRSWGHNYSNLFWMSQFFRFLVSLGFITKTDACICNHVAWNICIKWLKSLSIETVHDKTKKMTFVSSKDSDQPGHLPNLSSLMPRLIWVFAGHTGHLLVLSWSGPSNILPPQKTSFLLK